MNKGRIVTIAVILLTLAVLGAVAAGQFGLLAGRAPADLGVANGKLKAPSTSPNSVSSQAGLWPGHPREKDAAIAPLALRGGNGPATMAALQALLAARPDVRVVSARSDYIQAEFTTRLMRYTDDVEFWLDPAAGVVQVRSASRLGESDLGANRQRVEALRAALAAR
jgi:uncharacterized protein (DUF1499 family)